MRVSRRAFGRVVVGGGVALLLTADRVLLPPGRALPIALDADTARYLDALTDLPTAQWALLAATAAILDPGRSGTRGLFGKLPAGVARDATLAWTYRAEAERMREVLGQVARVYDRYLPPDRAHYYGEQLALEQARLAAGGQVDYSALLHLVTLVNREQGLIMRAEIADFHLIQQHRTDPRNQPKSVATLLHERTERRTLTTMFRQEAARLLGTTPQRTLTSSLGALTLFGDLGATSGDRARTYQLIRAPLAALDDLLLADQAVYFTAGEFLALEPPVPPGRWADQLPAAERAYAATNTLSPRLARGAILDPGHASRLLWATLPECRALVAELAAL